MQDTLTPISAANWEAEGQLDVLTFDLAGDARQILRKRQKIANFTTRVHYTGRHEIEIVVNGRSLGRAAFNLETDPL